MDVSKFDNDFIYDHLGVGGTTSEDDYIFSKDIDKKFGLGKYKDNNESGIDSEGESLNTRPQAQSSSGVTGTSTLYNPGSPKSSTSDRGSSIQTSSSDGQMIADALASIRDKVRIEQARPGRKWFAQNRFSLRYIIYHILR